MHRQLLRNPGSLDLTTPSDKQDEQKETLDAFSGQEHGKAPSGLAPLQAVVQYGGDTKAVQQNARLSSSYVPRRTKLTKPKQVEESEGKDFILDTS